MERIRVEFELDGLHALMFRAALAAVNQAPGRPLSESDLARDLVKSILEEDARDHDDAVPN
jgi:hypothetical protein